MALLKNNSARLITINHKDGADLIRYRILPGENPAVEVPDAACKLTFVKTLINSGALIQMVSGAADESESTGDDGGESEIDVLRAKCDEHGVDYDRRWGVAKLKQALEAAGID